MIDNLGKSSEQIGEITQTIEEIADQTNLLALNAAVRLPVQAMQDAALPLWL